MNIRLEAYKIIYKVLQKKVFSDKLLRQFKKRNQAQKADADLLYLIVKGVIKMKGNLDYIITLYTDPQKYKNTDLKIKIVLYIALYQMIYSRIPSYAAVDESVELAKKLFGEKVSRFVNAVLRNYQRNDQITYPEDPEDNLSLKYSFPKDLVRTWLQLWGEESTRTMCQYFNKNPLLNIRINMYATSREKLVRYFQRRDIELQPSPASLNMMYTDRFAEVLNDVAFSEGYFSVQDTSAAMVVELLDPQVDESILDMFAAPGGKTTYMAELMNNTGEIIAIDKFPNKIRKMKNTVERLQLSNIKMISQDAFKYGPVAAAFDKVLLDVPCSGWGVLQKKADLRWQQNQNIPELLRLQEAALKTGSQFVKVGGYLVYSTCTLNPDENEHQVEKFLIKNKNFILEPAVNYLPKKYLKNNYLLTLPFEHRMDGAFAAKLKRID